MLMWFKCQVDIGQFSSIIRLGPKCNPICIYMAERTSDTEHYLTEVEGNEGSRERDCAVACGEEGEVVSFKWKECSSGCLTRCSGGQLFILIQGVYVSAHACHGSMWESKNSLWELVFSFYHMGAGDWAQIVSFSLSLLQSWSFHATKLVPHQGRLHLTSLPASLRYSLGLLFKVRRQGHEHEFNMLEV